MEESQIGGLIISIVTGLIFYVTGLFIKKNPPKMINSLFGYRTKRSMKNQLLWDEANKYSAEIMMRYGLAYALISSILSVLFEGIYITFVILGLILVPITLMIIKIENRLKELDEEIEIKD